MAKFTNKKGVELDIEDKEIIGDCFNKKTIFPNIKRACEEGFVGWEVRDIKK